MVGAIFGATLEQPGASSKHLGPSENLMTPNGICKLLYVVVHSGGMLATLTCIWRVVLQPAQPTCLCGRIPSSLWLLPAHVEILNIREIQQIQEMRGIPETIDILAILEILEIHIEFENSSIPKMSLWTESVLSLASF